MKSSISLFSVALLLASGISALGASKSRQPDSQTEGERHLVRKGETLWGISHQHHVSIGDLMDLNHLDSTSIHEGQSLRIPQHHREAPPAPEPARVNYIVEKGESFRSIARQHGLSTSELQNANPKVDPDHLRPGTKLVISISGPEPQPRSHREEEAPAARGAVHLVGERDTFYSIAKKYGVSVDALVAANPGVKPERLHPGMQVYLPASKKKVTSRYVEPQYEPARRGRDDDRYEASRYRGRDVVQTSLKQSSYKERDGRKSLDTPDGRPSPHHYIVSPGETVASIAEAFDITERRLCEMNGMKHGGALRAGTEIRVPDRRVD